MGRGLTLAACGVVLSVAAASAQQPGRGPAGASDGAGDRHERVRALEPVLEEAVARGVRRVERQLSTVVPGLALFTGPVRARGFAIEGYGVFFDVEVPVVRRSLLWSMEMLEQMDGGLAAVLTSLRRRWDAMPEGPGQVAFGHLLEDLETSVGASPVARRTLTARDDAVAEPGGASPPALAARATTVDPSAAYREALIEEIAAAAVMVGRALPLTDGQWLTIAARDGRTRVHPRLERGGDTLEFRIAGRDLEALRAGRVSLEELLRLVERPSSP